MASPAQIQGWLKHGKVKLPEDIVTLVFQATVGPAPLFPGQVLTLDLNGDLVSAEPTSGDVLGVHFNSSESHPGDIAKYMPQGPVELDDWTDSTGLSDLIPNASYFLWPGGTLRTIPPDDSLWAIKVGNSVSERVLSVNIATKIAPGS